MIINLEELVPKNWIVERVRNNQIKVFYLNNGRGSSPKSFTLPKIINIDEAFVSACAMYLGDGKLSEDRNHLEFSSIDKDMVKFMLEFFKNRLNITKIHYIYCFKAYKEDAFYSLASYLNINNNELHLRKGDRFNKEAIKFQISGVVIREIYGRVLDKLIESKFLVKKAFRRAFLRGLFAAEGTIAINRKENYIVSINFCLHIKEDRIAELIQKALDLERISYVVKKTERDNSMLIRMTNWKNYHKCWKIGLFDLSQRKKKIFLDKINKTKFCCKISKKLKDKLLTMPNLSQRQLAFKIGVSPATICCLRKRNMFINVKNLIRLANLTNIPLYSIKQNLKEFAVNNRTIIKDSQFLDFVFKSQSEYIDYVPGNIKD